MGELARHHQVWIAVAVEIGSDHVLGRPRRLALGNRAQLPAVRIDAAEREAHVAIGYSVVLGIRLVHRCDVEMAVEIEIGHPEAVAAADRDTAELGPVDAMLTPRDEATIGGSGPSRGLANTERTPATLSQGTGTALSRSCASAQGRAEDENDRNRDGSQKLMPALNRNSRGTW